MIRGRLGYALALCGGAAFFIYYAGWLSWFTLLFLLALPLVSLALSWPAARRTALSLSARPAAVQKGETARFTAQFSTQSRLGTARAECVLRVSNALGVAEPPRPCAVSLVGRGRGRVVYDLRSDYCGRLLCRGERARCLDYLGLFSFSLGPATAAEVFVLPRVVPIAPQLTAALWAVPGGGDIHLGRAGDDTSETFDLRPYRPGDALKAVHWKLSSRTDALMVREFSQSVSCAVELLADLGGSLEGRDVVLDALASVHAFLWASGIGHRVSWYDPVTGELTARDVTGEDDWPPVLRALLSPPGAPGAAVALRAAQGAGLDQPRLMCFAAQWGNTAAAGLAQWGDALVLAPASPDLPGGVIPLESETLAGTLSALAI